MRWMKYVIRCAEPGCDYRDVQEAYGLLNRNRSVEQASTYRCWRHRDPGPTPTPTPAQREGSA